MVLLVACVLKAPLTDVLQAEGDLKCILQPFKQRLCTATTLCHAQLAHTVHNPMSHLAISFV